MLTAPRALPEFLMCRPAYYRIAYVINPWMSLERQANNKRAIQQWERLYAVLAKELKVKIRLLPPHRSVPDLVFTANAGLVRNKLFIRSNFRFPQRKKEQPYITRYFRQSKYRVTVLNPLYGFEGEGDALWVRDTLVFGFHFRSDAPAHQELAALLKTEVLPVELIDRRFYHLDTCFCPLNGDCALWFPAAFDSYSRQVLKQLIPDLIAVSEKDAVRFACNAIAVGSQLVVQAGLSFALKKQLARRGFALHPVDLSEFLKAGGSAKCLVLNLHR